MKGDLEGIAEDPAAADKDQGPEPEEGEAEVEPRRARHHPGSGAGENDGGDADVAPLARSHPAPAHGDHEDERQIGGVEKVPAADTHDEFAGDRDCGAEHHADGSRTTEKEAERECRDQSTAWVEVS